MKILLADDHALVREGLALMIRSFLPRSLVRQVGSWTAARQQAGREPFDLALLDIAMPGSTSWEGELRALLVNHPMLPVCIISGTAVRSSVQTAFNLGVRGYICKTAEAAEMQSALQQVLDGRTYLPPQAWPVAAAKCSQEPSGITLRQREVLGLLSEGRSNKEIGERLALTENTVKRHVHNIFRTLQAKNRVEAVQRARQCGMLPG